MARYSLDDVGKKAEIEMVINGPSGQLVLFQGADLGNQCDAIKMFMAWQREVKDG